MCLFAVTLRHFGAKLDLRMYTNLTSLTFSIDTADPQLHLCQLPRSLQHFSLDCAHLYSVPPYVFIFSGVRARACLCAYLLCAFVRVCVCALIFLGIDWTSLARSFPSAALSQCTQSAILKCLHTVASRACMLRTPRGSTQIHGERKAA